MESDAGQEHVEIRQLTIGHDDVATTLWNLSLSLAKAANLHKEKGHQRRGVLSALRGVTRYLHELNFPGEQIEPLDHILQALLDVEAGLRGSALFTPNQDKKKKNKKEGSSYWGLRGFLWAAMELRCRIDGVNYKVAAKTVARDLPEAYDALRRGKDPEAHCDARGRLQDLTNKLINMHDTIDKKEKYPKEDNAVRAIMDATRQSLAGAAGLSNGNSSLQHEYDHVLAMAKRHADRLSLAGGLEPL